MAGEKIALFADHDSPQLKALRDILLAQNADPHMLEIRLGGTSKPKMTVSSDKILWGGVDFSAIKSIHVRCTAPNTLPVLPPLLNDTTWAYYYHAYQREQQFQSATYSFLEHLVAQGKLVINPLTSAYIDHDSKSQFYEKLRAWGFDTPLTLTTNDPDKANVFINSQQETLVKPAIGLGNARTIGVEDRQRFDELRHFPLFLQERVMGDTIRVHIVGDSVVLALRVINEGDVDSRIKTQGFAYFQMPEVEQEKIVRATRRLGLHYAAWDIIASADNSRYCYLDCNPGPYIMWIGNDNVHGVFSQLARYMISFSQTGSLEAASASVTPVGAPPN